MTATVGTEAFQPTQWARILDNPTHDSGLVQIPVCSARGAEETLLVSRGGFRVPLAYRFGKRASWGDMWPYPDRKLDAEDYEKMSQQQQ